MKPINDMKKILLKLLNIHEECFTQFEKLAVMNL